jgi:uncharacterized protein (TIGR02452 family)
MSISYQLNNNSSDHCIRMNKKQLTNIAKENLLLVEKLSLPIPVTKKICYDQPSIKECRITDSSTTVAFLDMKTDDCAIFLSKHGYNNIVALNHASAHSHGGGYIKGAKAQEEDLCRVMPELYPSLTKISYPYESDAVLITNYVTIMRNNTNYEFLEEKDYVTIGMVSAAAQDLKNEKYDGDRIMRTLQNLYCSVAHHLPNTETLILGAWGCGVYGNDPWTISRAMNYVNKRYGGYFKHIVFSIPGGPNLEEFKKNIECFSGNDVNFYTLIANAVKKSSNDDSDKDLDDKPLLSAALIQSQFQDQKESRKPDNHDSDVSRQYERNPMNNKKQFRKEQHTKKHMSYFEED